MVTKKNKQLSDDLDAVPEQLGCNQRIGATEQGLVPFFVTNGLMYQRQTSGQVSSDWQW